MFKIWRDQLKEKQPLTYVLLHSIRFCFVRRSVSRQNTHPVFMHITHIGIKRGGKKSKHATNVLLYISEKCTRLLHDFIFILIEKINFKQSPTQQVNIVLLRFYHRQSLPPSLGNIITALSLVLTLSFLLHLNMESMF